ncbi:MAG: biotin/lipoyl-binding protein, partial [Nitrospinae bacterium]|nr:biotin/lipoyl-binding protein [Nitrospinota bacterium]
MMVNRWSQFGSTTSPDVALGRVTGGREVRIVVNTEADALAIRGLERPRHISNRSRPEIVVVAEPTSWRGTGGLLGDMSRDISPDNVVVLIETNCLPPPSLEPLLRALEDGETMGVVGAGTDHEPAGIYAFDHAAISLIPEIGYYDLKEQLLPALNGIGRPVRLARMTERIIRLRDRSGYLQAVQVSLQRGGPDGPRSRCSPLATVSPLARIAGRCIIERGVVVEADAVVVPVRSADLSLPSAGTVAELLVAVGEQVDAGQVLVRLDAEQEAAALAEAGAALESARADLAQLTAAQAKEEA